MLNLLDMIDWFYLFLLTFYGELWTGYYQLRNLSIKQFWWIISLYNPELARLYVNIFQDSRTQLSTTRYVDYDVLYSDSTETKSQKLYISN